MKPGKEVSFWGRLNRCCRFMETVLFSFAMLLIMGLMFLTAVDVIGRFFGSPISGSYQMSELAQLWIICLAWPLTIRASSHVSVSFFIAKQSPVVKKVAEILTCLISMGIFAGLAWQSIEMIRRSYEQAELVNILDIPLYPFQLAVPIGASISFAVLFVQLCMLAAGRTVKNVEK